MTAGIILAAGKSRRMGSENKLLLPIHGEPLIRVCAGILLKAGVEPLVVVLGYHAKEVEKALAGLPLSCVVNPRFEQGMGTSLATGVAALPVTATLALVALGDMPGLRVETIRQVLSGREGRGIALPSYQGKRGHPVVFDLTRYRDQLCALDGDQGARRLISEHPDDVAFITVDDPGVVQDLDTRDAYEVWVNRKQTTAKG